MASAKGGRSMPAAQGGSPSAAWSRRVRRRHRDARHDGRGVRAQPARARPDTRHAQARGATRLGVYAAADLAGVRPIVARSGLPGFKVSEQPVLAADRVRLRGRAGRGPASGETRAAAEGSGGPRGARPGGAARGRRHASRARAGRPRCSTRSGGDNVFLESAVDADLDDIERTAEVSVTRTFRTARQCMSPIEGRGVLAYWDRRLEMLVLHTACQIPAHRAHRARGVPGARAGPGTHRGPRRRRRVRLQGHPAPGGGWCSDGSRCIGNHPVRWIEDRREQLVAQCELPRAPLRHHRPMPRPTAPCSPSTARRTSTPARTPRIRSPRAWRRRRWRASCPDPTSSNATGAGPGRWRPTSHPSSPTAGVARTGVCFALEVLLDCVARAPRHGSRRAAPAEPGRAAPDAVSTTSRGKHFRQRRLPGVPAPGPPAAIDLPAIRERQRRGETDGRRGRGGVSRSSASRRRTAPRSTRPGGVPMIPGHEQAGARMTPSGRARGPRRPLHSHGQGLETTLAQVAHEVSRHRPRQGQGSSTAIPP